MVEGVETNECKEGGEEGRKGGGSCEEDDGEAPCSPLGSFPASLESTTSTDVTVLSLLAFMELNATVVE